FTRAVSSRSERSFSRIWTQSTPASRASAILASKADGSGVPCESAVRSGAQQRIGRDGLLRRYTGSTRIRTRSNPAESPEDSEDTDAADETAEKRMKHETH